MQDPKDPPRQGSPERKRRSVIIRISSSSCDCAFHAFNHTTAAFLEPGVQHIAASEAHSIAPVDFVGSTPLSVLDHG